MGNALAPCFQPNGLVRLVFWGGATRFLTEKQLAGELMFEFPDRVVCHANSFFIGHPLPVLAIEDELRSGETYFVLPVDCFPCDTLTVASLAALSTGARPSLAGVGNCPLEYVKGSDGRSLIKVSPDFIARAITADDQGESGGARGGSICSTPELQKHYAQLVGLRERPWSPKLETISERKNRSSPVRLLVGWKGDRS